MKVVLPNETKKKFNFEGILPLVEDPEPKQLKKGTYSTFHLRTVPTDNDSPTYDFVVPYLYPDATVRQAIHFKRKMDKVIYGLNILTSEGKKNIMEQMLKDSLVPLYAQSVESSLDAQFTVAQQDEEDPVARAALVRPDVNRIAINYGWEMVMEYITPPKALSRVKRYLRRQCRKPKDMTIRQYYTRLLAINETELTALPPFMGNAQKLSPDEVVDIMCYGVPNSWNKELTRQGRDPMDMSPGQLLEFFENQEQTEDFNLVENKGDKKQSSNGKDKSKGKRKNESDGSKYCMLHGKGSHTTEECKTLKSEAKRLKEDRPKGNGKNKTWKRKDEKKELNVAEATKKEITKQVKAAVKELNVMQSKAKKRRIVDDDDDDTVEEGNNVELDPATFNYQDLEEKLKISSDDEVSV